MAVFRNPRIAQAPVQPRCCDQIEYAGDNRVCADDGDQHERGNARH
jgi:hypothetical protein